MTRPAQSAERALTSRRSVLKVGALAAAPIAVLAPASALAGDDGTRSRLIQLEDQRAIEELSRAFLRRFNGDSSADCSEFLASSDAVEIGPNLRSITEDMSADPLLEMSGNRKSARYSRACLVEVETGFDGNSTMEQMARFQGQGSHRHSEKRMMKAHYVKADKAWQIASLKLA